MSDYVRLTRDQAELVLTMLNFIHSMPTCADELLDCSYEELDALEEALNA